MNAIDNLAGYAAAAAKLLNCAVEDLLSYRWSNEEQLFIAIAPSGQKHRFEVEALEAAMAPPRQAEPVEAPPATDSPLPSGSRSSQGEGADPAAIVDQLIEPPTPEPPKPPRQRPAYRRKAKAK